jgi:hypothetical protein
VKAVPQPSPPPPKIARIRLANWERCLPKKFVIATTPSDNSLNIDVEIEMTDTAMKRNTSALVDCGATGLFIDTEYVCLNNLSTCRLTSPIPVYNVDGTANEAGAITEIADVILCYKGHAERTQFAVTSLGKQNMILGFTWLREHNPEIDWQTKEVRMSRCPLIARLAAPRLRSNAKQNALRLLRFMHAALVASPSLSKKSSTKMTIPPWAWASLKGG